MVVSGAPEKDPNHAEKVCDMALDMVEAITDLKDPSTGRAENYTVHSIYCLFIIPTTNQHIIKIYTN